MNKPIFDGGSPDSVKFISEWIQDLDKLIELTQKPNLKPNEKELKTRLINELLSTSKSAKRTFMIFKLNLIDTCADTSNVSKNKTLIDRCIILLQIILDKKDGINVSKLFEAFINEYKVLKDDTEKKKVRDTLTQVLSEINTDKLNKYLESFKPSDSTDAQAAPVVQSTNVPPVPERKSKPASQLSNSLAATTPQSAAPRSSSSAGPVPMRAAIREKFEAYNAIKPKEQIHIPTFLTVPAEPKTTTELIDAVSESVGAINKIIATSNQTVKSNTILQRTTLKAKINHYRQQNYTGSEKLNLDIIVGGKRKRSKKIGTRKKQHKRK